MQFDIDNTTVLFIAGVIILTASLMLHLRKRCKIEAEKKAKRRAAIQSAKEAEHKRQIQTGTPIKIKAGSLAPDRVPLTEPYDHTFTGSAAPRNLAKWEAEIDHLGREMIGRLDSKMIALQTLTLEANRTANRLELLVEHLEQLRAAYGPALSTPQTDIISEVTEENLESEPTEESVEQANLLSVANSDTHLEAFSDVLQDLESELDRFRDDLDDSLAEPVLPATVLKSEEFLNNSKNPKKEPIDGRLLPPTIALSTGNPLEEPAAPAVSRRELFEESAEKSKNPLSLSAPSLPGESGFSALPPNIRIVPDDLRKATATSSETAASAPNPRIFTSNSGSKRITVTATQTASRPNTGLSLDSLYEKDWKARKEEPAFSVAGSRAFDSERGRTTPPVAVPQQLLKEGSRLALRKQVEMLADYGYTANQIAQNLNITVGEVDLMLSLRG